MSAPTIPDIEIAIIDFLLQDFELADIVSTRIYPQSPNNAVYPYVTARLLSERSGMPRWLEAATIEVAGWAHRNVTGARKEARDACEFAVRALQDLENTIIDDLVLCGPIATFDQGQRDDQIEPGVTNPRFITDVSLTYHPAQSGS